MWSFERGSFSYTSTGNTVPSGKLKLVKERTTDVVPGIIDLLEMAGISVQSVAERVDNRNTLKKIKTPKTPNLLNTILMFTRNGYL